MSAKKSATVSLFRDQETIRLDQNERAKLDAILLKAEKDAKGRVLKADIIKELMGLYRHSLTAPQDRLLLLEDGPALPAPEGEEAPIAATPRDRKRPTSRKP